MRRRSLEKANTISASTSTSPTIVSRSRSLSESGRRRIPSASRNRNWPAVQDRDRQQVEHRQVDRDDPEEAEEDADPGLGRRRRHLPDQDRAADVLPGDPPRQHAAHRAHHRGRGVDRGGEALADRLREARAARTPPGPEFPTPIRPTVRSAPPIPCTISVAGHDREQQLLRPARHDQRQRVVRVRLDHGRQVPPLRRRRAVHRQDRVARLEPGAIRGTAGRAASSPPRGRHESSACAACARSSMRVRMHRQHDRRLAGHRDRHAVRRSRT